MSSYYVVVVPNISAFGGPNSSSSPQIKSALGNLRIGFVVHVCTGSASSCVRDSLYGDTYDTPKTVIFGPLGGVLVVIFFSSALGSTCTYNFN